LSSKFKAAVALPWEVVKVIMGSIIIFTETDLKKIPLYITIPSCFFELGIIVCMAIVLHLQSTYVPFSCKNAARWEFDSIGKPTLFMSLAQHWSKKISPEQVCTTFIYKRTVGIVFT
jgi:hypothetical protein